MSLRSPVSCAYKACLFLLYLLLSDESYSLDDESEELGSDSGCSGTYYFCAFSLSFYKSVVGLLGSEIFTQTRVDSKGGIFVSEMFLLTGVKSKGGVLNLAHLLSLLLQR